MADIRLWVHPRQDVVAGLPRVCMKCGAPATTAKVIHFAWYPPWLLALLPLGVLPVLLLIAIITKRQRVKEPFCREHENHFFLIRVLRAVGWFGFLVAPVLFILGAAANPKGNLAGYLCCGWIVLMVVYLVVVRVFALLTKIRPTDITDRSITLTNVSDDFADAMEEDEEDDWDRPAERQKRRRRGDDRYQGGQGRSPRRSTDNSEEGPIV